MQSGTNSTIGLVFTGSDPAVCVNQVAFLPDPAKPTIEMDLTVRSAKPGQFAFEFQLLTGTGVQVGVASAGSFEPNRLECMAGETTARWAIDASHLATGNYQLVVVMLEPFERHYARVEHREYFNVLRIPQPPASRVLEQSWQIGHVELHARRLQ